MQPEKKAEAVNVMADSFVEKLHSFVAGLRNEVENHPLNGVDSDIHGEWLDEVDVVDPLACPLEDLQRMVETAPTPETRCWLIGILEVRQRLHVISLGFER